MQDQDRLDFAVELARKAGAFAKHHFQAIDALVIESKGHQDLVSNADKDTETLIRAALAEHYPDDGIVGEEHGRKHGSSGYDWVIDPIDGTANFVRGIPQWCVAIACAKAGEAVIGVIFEPSSDEMFTASKGGGAFVNGKPLRAVQTDDIGQGSIGIGFSGRAPAMAAATAVAMVIERGGVFFRNASGALMLAYVAAGRLLGYIEEHMNSWDCVAGLLMIEEAGGTIVKPDPTTSLDHGTVVIAGGANMFDEIKSIAETSFSQK
ncbi:inositol monophosphatase/fructose-1,6-bisphosphatase family protein [Hoeflea sp. IMCC20628]|uniref:inositol monophosphatase family protein n=1 Tax=Hoeflea sp. IMCC20628 TaxID=1620421 RepID=UPI00063AB8F8|nr:inositol monophosphatase family protein [Hoeflea sp. IMCC20628]AKH99390.1 inositol monophosphatase/fructose-1,6-bisphosphatase family protein [Hoeflea sp. IMCC20628]